GRTRSRRPSPRGPGPAGLSGTSPLEHGPSRPEERVKCTTHSPCHALLLTASPASGTRRAAPYPLTVRTDTDLLVASASPCRPSLGYVTYEQAMTERACVVLERAPSLASPRRVSAERPQGLP